jgi:4-amino-4-deoxy-L-arabinose transferase-like glycosyltransferase
MENTAILMSRWQACLLLFLVSFGVRIAANPVPIPLAGDAQGYQAKAISLLHGDGYQFEGKPTSFKPPGYPAFLAGVYRLLGTGDRSVILAQSLLGALTALWVVAICSRLGLQPVALAVGWLMALSPPMIRSCGLLLTESLSTFLLAAAVWSGILLVQDRRRWIPWTWGASLGLLILTRSAFILFPLFWAAAALLSSYRVQASTRYETIRRLLIGGLVCMTLIGGWTWRNAQVHNDFVLLSTDGGRALYASYCPPDGYRFGLNTKDAVSDKADAIPDEVARDRYYMTTTWNWITTHPGELPRLLAWKILYLLSPLDWELIGRDGQARIHWLYGLLAPFALLGWIQYRRDPHARWFWALFLYLGFLTVLFYGSPRLRLPFEPYLFMLGAWGLRYGLSRLPFINKLRSAASDAT